WNFPPSGECGFAYFSGLGSSQFGVDLSPRPLRARTNLLMDEIPSRCNVLPMRFLHQPERCVAELDHRFAAFFAQAILHIVGHGIRHEQRTAELQQRGLVDGLHRRPEVAVAVTEVAEPPSARPGLQLHGHTRAVRALVGRPNLLEQRRECYVDWRLTRISCSTRSIRFSISGTVMVVIPSLSFGNLFGELSCPSPEARYFDWSFRAVPQSMCPVSGEFEVAFSR